MTILATVDYGKFQVSQAWELLEDDPNPFLLVNELKDGSQIVLRLDKAAHQANRCLRWSRSVLHGSVKDF